MGIFGWNYPPGCSGPPDEDPICQVCHGNYDADECICPECHVCGEAGDPYCYGAHGMVRSQAQIDLRDTIERQWEEEARAETECFADLEQKISDE